MRWRLEVGDGGGGSGSVLVGMRRRGVKERGCELILLLLHSGMGGEIKIAKWLAPLKSGLSYIYIYIYIFTCI